MQSIVLTELGIVALDGSRRVASFPFADAAAEYMAIRRGEGEIDALVAHAESLDSGVTVNDEALLDALRARSVEARALEESEVSRIQADKIAILVEAGFASGEEDAASKLRDFAMGLSSAKVSEASQSPDAHIIQAIRAMDEADRALNGHNSRLREWYGLHFPELENVIDGIAPYARVARIGDRADISGESLTEAGLDKSVAEMVLLMAPKSRGGEIAAGSLAMVRDLAEHILHLSAHRHELEAHVNAEMESVAPNTSAILGALIGARVISRAGSLTRLATMPASSIQVLGAEKALFRSLKTGALPPKHGLLFQHALVHAAPRWQRGRMARAIASKAAIAARVDVYGGGLNETLLEKLNVRVREIGTVPRPEPREGARPGDRGARQDAPRHGGSRHGGPPRRDGRGRRDGRERQEGSRGQGKKGPRGPRRRFDKKGRRGSRDNRA